MTQSFPGCRPFNINQAALCSAGMILISAAVIKLADSPEAVLSDWRNWYIFAAMVLLTGFELFLGVWLISGLAPTWARQVACLTFFTFTCYSLAMVVLQRNSCGCLGSVHVSPYAMLALDVSVLVWLLLTPQPNSCTVSRHQALRQLTPLAGFCVVFCCGWTVMNKAVFSDAMNGFSSKYLPIHASNMDIVSLDDLLNSVVGCSPEDRRRLHEQKHLLVIMSRATCSHCRDFIEKVSSCPDIESRNVVVMLLQQPLPLVVHPHVKLGEYVQPRLWTLPVKREIQWKVKVPAVITFEHGKPVRFLEQPSNLEDIK